MLHDQNTTKTQDEEPKKKQSSFDPRWDHSWSFHLLRFDDPAGILEHYRVSATHWREAFIKERSRMVSLMDELHKLRLRVDSMEVQIASRDLNSVKPFLVCIVDGMRHSTWANTPSSPSQTLVRGLS
jgi:hypothetical protein